ncbi:MAG: hypothetical protein JRG73_03540 [Deltaproteobacteria bacterium]|nr:hypothetical protein [Deltaproteobacteria bacterium]
MMKKIRWGYIVIASLSVMLIISLSFSTWAAEEDKDKDKRPERGMVLAPEYTGVIVDKGEKVRMDLIVKNLGKRGEIVELEIASAPKGWEPVIKTYDFKVTGVYVDDGEEKNLTFLAEPEKDVGPGEYEFVVSAQTEDGAFKSTQKILVKVEEEKEGEEKEEEITITTAYPVLRGPSDTKFEFSLDVKNEVDEEKTFTLTAKAPQYWEVNFKPPYEDKYFSSLRIKEEESKSLNVVVQPFLYAEAGEYPIDILVDSGKAKAEAKLTVVLTGTYKLDMGTPTGLLSVAASKGKPANMSVFIKNTGSATNHNITFMSFKPENWKVEFEPEKIEVIEPGDMKQVEITITPAEEALVGDYSVAISAKGEKAEKDIEARVTVKASAAWGWIGIGIIVLVVLGLGGLFARLGRR